MIHVSNTQIKQLKPVSTETGKEDSFPHLDSNSPVYEGGPPGGHHFRGVWVPVKRERPLTPLTRYPDGLGSICESTEPVEESGKEDKIRDPSSLDGHQKREDRIRKVEYVEWKPGNIV